jgi:hypothetical protein
MVVVFYTLFGVAVLSLSYPGLGDLDPVCCTSVSLIECMGLKGEPEDAPAALGVKTIV